VVDRLKVMALHVLRRFPEGVRQRIVRLVKPAYTLGAMVFIEHEGQVLLVKPSYRWKWGMPGGLLDRRERPAEAARREAFEEVGAVIELDPGDPIVVVESLLQRIDFVFRARLADGVDPTSIHPTSTEIEQLQWFSIAELPEMQPEASQAVRALLAADQQGRRVLTAPLPEDPTLG
jgi:8-oxo-dGTP pyrophosphatase MutT (NUDIX family)